MNQTKFNEAIDNLRRPRWRIPTAQAKQWLASTTHRKGCQCHRCLWAMGVLGGRVAVDFETWEKRK